MGTAKNPGWVFSTGERNTNFIITAKEIPFTYTFEAGQFYYIYITSTIKDERNFLERKFRTGAEKVDIKLFFALFDDTKPYSSSSFLGGIPFPRNLNEPTVLIPIDVTLKPQKL